MKAASVQEIKQSLKNLEVSELADICLRLARFKKENKELLTFLLFESDDPDHYIKSVKEEIDIAFAGINTSNIYFIKKSIRKILRMTNKYIRYTGSDIAEVEILLHFCTSFKGLNIQLNKSAAMMKLYDNQIKKLTDVISGMHEDLQYDYIKSLNRLK
jgi:hypothetical protein